ncbi:hypothetical protein [Pseudomonas sp. CGJS7]|uniref:hypothetical protein n=1 Tax=Pseudomonas sp. CGJS7 TaxID=3109348 RepID=UPI003009F378
MQPLATGDRAREQQRLTRGLDALLDGRFQVRAHRLFVLDGDTDWIGVKAFARGHIENQFGGMWLDAPPANEDVSAMVWRTARPTTGYVALAWLQPDDEAAPNDRNLVFGYFELEKNAGAPADLENPKAHMFGGAR